MRTCAELKTLVLYLLLSLPLVGTYALLALGITVIYQASRVLNLAHGALAMAAAYTTFQLAHWHIAVPVAVLLGIVAGTLLGYLVERVFVRRLRQAGPTTQTVGTVAALTFAIAIAAHIWGTLPVTAPAVLPHGALHLGSGFVPFDLLGIFPASVVVLGLAFVLFRFTDVGLAMRGAAQNRRGAALRGIDPDRMASIAWALGGALAGVSGILLAGATRLDPFSASLGVLPAFVAALIGGLESMPGVALGALIVGLVQGMVPLFSHIPAIGTPLKGQGAAQLVLGVLALGVMAFKGVRLSAATTQRESF